MAEKVVRNAEKKDSAPAGKAPEAGKKPSAPAAKKPAASAAKCAVRLQIFIRANSISRRGLPLCL